MPQEKSFGAGNRTGFRGSLQISRLGFLEGSTFSLRNPTGRAEVPWKIGQDRIRWDEEHFNRGRAIKDRDE
jgi:hypothetical protein